MSVTPEQQELRDKRNIDRRELLAAYGDAMRRVADTRNKPIGGRRNKYIAALLLMVSKDVGFLELDRHLFDATEASVQTSFNAASDKHNKPTVTAWEHSTGRKVIIDYKHPMGEESFTRWLLMVDHGMTPSEITALTAEYVAAHNEADDNEATEEWVEQVIDALYEDQ
jgi:hypothetical protein